MQAEAPRPYFSQDTGIPSGMSGIQDQALPSVGGERSDNHQEQGIPPRPELVQQFIQQIGRWSEALEGEDYSLHVYPTEAGYAVEQENQILDEGVGHIWVSGGRVRLLFDKPYKANILTRNRGLDPIYIERGFDPGNYVERHLGVGFHTGKRGAAGFIDPYNNRPITDLEIGVKETPYDFNRYQLYVGVEYADKKEGEHSEAVTYYEPNAKERDVIVPSEIQITHQYRGYNIGDAYPVLLSGDVDAHAKALVDLADSIVPQVNQELPEPAAVEE